MIIAYNFFEEYSKKTEGHFLTCCRRLAEYFGGLSRRQP